MSASSLRPGPVDGAHWSAMPVVPWAMVRTGRPSPGAGVGGTSAVPVTAIGAPPRSSDMYMIRQALAPATSRPSTGW